MASSPIVDRDSADRYRVGLTGGIASGKSTVAKLFAALGVPIIDADEVARDVVAPGTALLATLGETFGPGILQPSGALDRRALRNVVFADPDARRTLEGLMHPAIRAETDRRIAAARGPYVMLAIPLLAETNGKGRVDRVLVVDCPEDVQIRRLQARDGSTREQALAILAAQATRTQRLAIADDVIRNDGEVTSLSRDVERLHAQYLEAAANR